MKKIVRTIAFLMVMNLPMVGCQEDAPLPVQQSIPTKDNPDTAYTVVYIVDGQSYTTTLQSDEDWTVFLNHLFALAEEGHVVSFRSADSDIALIARETVVYRTSDKSDAIAWSKAMTLNGYKVSVGFDSQTGIYTCTAIR